MDINQLRYFISVAQTLNFSEAARRNGLTQPSISHHISELEKQLETQLFIRDKRSVILTDTGRAFLPRAVEVVELVQKSALQLKKMDAGESGQLTVSALTTASSMLSRCLAAFSKKYPDITVDIRLASGLEQTMVMNEDKYDLHFAITDMVPSGDSFEMISVGSDRLCLTMPADHPLADEFKTSGVDFSRLTRERFIACSQNDGPALYKRVMLLCANRSYKPVIVSQCDRTEAILLSVGAGLGISILPHAMRDVFYSENVAFFPLDGDDALRNYVLAWHKPIVNPAVKLFADTIRPLFEN